MQRKATGRLQLQPRWSERYTTRVIQQAFNECWITHFQSCKLSHAQGVGWLQAHATHMFHTLVALPGQLWTKLLKLQIGRSTSPESVLVH